ncbi:hypothetical protein GCM10020218_076130 [Dactylosporangium vinaceum]
MPGENLAGATAVVYVVPQQGHYLAVYGRRLDGRDPAVAQPDLSAVPEIADVLRQSASLGGAAVSTAAVDPDGSRTLNLATPVLSPDGSLRGLVLLGLRGPEFLRRGHRYCRAPPGHRDALRDPGGRAAPAARDGGTRRPRAPTRSCAPPMSASPSGGGASTWPPTRGSCPARTPTARWSPGRPGCC